MPPFGEIELGDAARDEEDRPVNIWPHSHLLLPTSSSCSSPPAPPLLTACRCSAPSHVRGAVVRRRAALRLDDEAHVACGAQLVEDYDARGECHCSGPCITQRPVLGLRQWQPRGTPGGSRGVEEEVRDDDVEEAHAADR